MGIDELLITLDKVSGAIQKGKFSKIYGRYMAKDCSLVRYISQLCSNCLIYTDKTYNWDNIQILRHKGYAVDTKEYKFGTCGCIIINGIGIDFKVHNDNK